MPLYYPSAVVELALRLKEPFSPAELDKWLRSAAEHPAAIRAKKSADTYAKRMSTVLDSDASDPYSVKFFVQPVSCEWTANSPREANTATVKVKFADLPIDPRSVMAVGVTLFAGTVAADDYRAGIEERESGGAGRRSFVKRERSTTRFMGTVDSFNSTFGDSGDSLSIECRDFTGMLIDTPVPTAVLKKLRVSQKLAGVVEDLLHSLPATANMPVMPDDDIDRTSLDKLVLREVLGGTRKGGEASKGAKLASTKGAGTTYWDLITDLCVKSGVIPMIDLDELRLVKPRTLYLSQARSAPRMIWGGNLKELRFSRSFGKTTIQGVKIVALSGKEVKVGQYPKKLRPKATASKDGALDSYKVYDVTGRAMQASMLPKIAEAIYYESAMQGCEATFATDDMEAFGLDGTSVDLLVVQAGDAVNILIADLANPSGNLRPLFAPATAAEIEGKSTAQIADILSRRGVGSAVAPAIAAALANARRLSTFRVQDVSHSIGESGYSGSYTCMSFLELDPRLVGESAGGLTPWDEG